MNMWWTLAVCVLLGGLPLSSQDMVTLAPSTDVSNPTTTEASTETPAQTPTETPSFQEVELKPSIRSLHIKSDIKYRYATTLVSSRVVNPSNQSGQAAFSLTLPESAFISEFLMEVKGKAYKAYVKEKQEAKNIYNEAVESGQFAGHVALDARDSNQFTVSVNLEAHGKVTFNLTYEQLLSRNLDFYSNVININPQQIVEDMSVRVEIEEPTAIKDLMVPEIQVSNEVFPDKTKSNTLAKVEDKSTSHKVVVWSPSIEEQKTLNSTGVSGQFIVHYDVDRTQNSQQILVDEGHFVHFFAPTDLPQLRKHVVFVLDNSGSMMGRKIQQLKDAMKKILSDLNDKDYFSIAIFESDIQAWAPEKQFRSTSEPRGYRRPHETPAPDVTTAVLDKEFVVKATTTNINLAQNYLDRLSDTGATNIMGGLRVGLQLVNIGSEMWMNESNPPQPVMIFLTDGQPNVEESDTDAIIKKTKPLNNHGCPIFSLAFGYDADLNFLRKLSLSNSGFARTIYEAADASQQLKKFYRSISSPLLANVTFNYLPGQVNETSQTKVNFPVFFSGSELVVAGRMDKVKVCPQQTTEKPFGELTADTASGRQVFPIVIRCFEEPMVNRSQASHLEKTWAYLSIQQLLDKAASLDEGVEKSQTKEKALKLALQFSFVTPLTSLVVVKPNETESSVDTTKVKPGLGDSLMGFNSHISAAGFSRPLSAIHKIQATVVGGEMVSYTFPQAPQPPIHLRYGSYGITPVRKSSFMHYADFDDADSVEDLQNPSATAKLPDSVEDLQNPSTTAKLPDPQPSVRKVSLSTVKWLQPYLTNSSNSGNVTVPVNGKDLLLDLDSTNDDSFGSCSVNGEPGECRHFKFCVLDVFQDDVSQFTPYQCSINNRFLGVCCPQVAS